VRAEGETERRALADVLRDDPAPPSKARGGDRAAGEGFCDACRAESTDASPGDIGTRNGIGRMFYGQEERCHRCYSVVRVLWIVFVFSASWFDDKAPGDAIQPALVEALLAARLSRDPEQRTRWRDFLAALALVPAFAGKDISIDRPQRTASPS
jgi:hypothetical protein